MPAIAVRLDAVRIPAALNDGLTLAGLIVGLYFVLGLHPGTAADAMAYYGVDLVRPYEGSQLNGYGAYLYSPAFAQLTEPLRALSFDAFVVGWRVVAVLVLAWLAGPLTLPLLFLGPVASELNAGNINLLLAGAIVAGFRYPGAWALLILTKVTPGVILVWFAVRREWRALGIVTALMGAIVAVSFALAPQAWFDWVRLLATEGTVPRRTDWEVVNLGLPLRLAIGAVVVAWGARGNHRWVIPFVAFLALPATWWPALSVLVAAAYLLRPRPERRWSRPSVMSREAGAHWTAAVARRHAGSATLGMAATGIRRDAGRRPSHATSGIETNT